jgi:indole-3-glycerol phosphate synthase
MNPGQLKRLAGFARSLGLEVLMEIHNEQELIDNLHPEVDIIGVNNRDLKTFKISIQNSIRLAEKIPPDYMKISESGINDPLAILELKKYGFKGFLIGEYFMQHSRPEKQCAAFIQWIREMERDVTVKS